MAQSNLKEKVESYTTSYLDFFQLKSPPFDEVRNPLFFFESDEHREALERLTYVIEDGNMNFGLLTGEIGSGKTITRTVLQHRLNSERFLVLCLENSFFDFEDLVYELLSRIEKEGSNSRHMEGKGGLPARGDRYAIVRYFREFLESLFQNEKRRLVLILDEAQSLAHKDLDALKNLTNISYEDHNLLTIVLVGQPELREHVRALKQVDQRVGLSFHLNNLDLENVGNYVRHRLQVAGHQSGELFHSKAFVTLFRHTLGIPREINRACKLALEYSFANETPEIGEDAVKVILDDIHKHRV